jgi:hypothetical protein
MSKLKARLALAATTSLAALVEQLRTRPSRSRPKVKMIDGVPHRLRRGVLVAIPPEWFGHVAHKQTIRKRASKQGQGPSYVSKAQR